MAQSRNIWKWQLSLASSLTLFGAIFSFGDYCIAQVTPDATLGAQSSVVKLIAASPAPPPPPPPHALLRMRTAATPLDIRYLLHPQVQLLNSGNKLI